jgi:O-antigen/teichoic acid export membrane protein
MHPEGDLEAGIYASAYRLLDAANIGGFFIASFLLPFIARNRENKKLVQSAILNSRHFLMLLAIIPICFTIFFAPWLQEMLYHSDNPYHSTVLTLCLLSLPGYFLVHIYGSALTATGQFKTLISLLLASILINAIMNVILIPIYGAKGCCLAAIASQYFCGIGCFIMTGRTMKMSADKRSIVFYFITAAVFCMIFYLLKISVNNVWSILVTMVLLVGLALIIGRNQIKKLISVP